MRFEDGERGVTGGKKRIKARRGKREGVVTGEGGWEEDRGRGREEKGKGGRERQSG